MEDNDVLRRIALHTEKRVARFKKEWPVDSLRREPLYARAPLDFSKAFDAGAGTPRVIAEVKFASPSEGFLRPQPEATKEEAARIASAYMDNGAAAVSVLTERNFFGGAPGFLTAARLARPDAPLLMKDFTIDAYQLELARASGADCVLLIAALLGEKLAYFEHQASLLGLSALVEVHDEAELEIAKGAGCRLIGVNSRDLRTLKTDLNIARSLAKKAPGAVMIAESGLRTRADLDELGALGYRGFLIGTTLMKQPDPGAALKALLAG